jgi:hypothetical protein
MRTSTAVTPVSALLIVFSFACAPVAASAPNDEHCTRLQKTIDSFDPKDGSLFVQKTIAMYQIQCLGSASPSVGQVVRNVTPADARPDHPDHPDHPANPAKP